MSLQSFLLRRALPALAAAAVIAVPTAAQADDHTISINPGNVPTTALAFEDQSCKQVPDTIAPTQDGWVFVLPGNKSEFIKVTATFEDLNGDTQVYNTDDHGGIDDGPGSGTSKAYIITPAGWTLIDAEAETTQTGGKDQFNLTHTCPGEVPPGETPSTDVPPTDTPTTKPGEEEPSTPPTDGPTSPGDSVGTSPVPDEKLASTGTGLTWVIVGGIALIGAGAAAVFLMRRRSSAETH